MLVMKLVSNTRKHTLHSIFNLPYYRIAIVQQGNKRMEIVVWEVSLLEDCRKVRVIQGHVKFLGIQ